MFQGAVAGTLVLLVCLFTADPAYAAGPRFAGCVLYRTNKAAAAGVQVDLVEARDDGRPTDEILATARADADGRFVVFLDKPTDAKLALVVSAARESAESGGDRRREGYEIRTVRIRLAVLPFPSASKSNTILIDRRKPGTVPSEDEDR